MSFEPKYNLTYNSNIGLRLGGVTYSVGSSDLDEKYGSNYAATYDYYFHKEASSFTPFFGAGLGIYKIRGYQDWTIFGYQVTTTDSKFGVMIRGGIEIGKLRLALEYNIVPKTDFEGGEIKNSYLGASIGFYVGGGKWKKAN